MVKVLTLLLVIAVLAPTSGSARPKRPVSPPMGSEGNSVDNTAGQLRKKKSRTFAKKHNLNREQQFQYEQLQRQLDREKERALRDGKIDPAEQFRLRRLGEQGEAAVLKSAHKKKRKLKKP